MPLCFRRLVREGVNKFKAPHSKAFSAIDMRGLGACVDPLSEMACTCDALACELNDEMGGSASVGCI